MRGARDIFYAIILAESGRIVKGNARKKEPSGAPFRYSSLSGFCASTRLSGTQPIYFG